MLRVLPVLGRSGVVARLSLVLCDGVVLIRERSLKRSELPPREKIGVAGDLATEMGLASSNFAFSRPSINDSSSEASERSGLDMTCSGSGMPLRFRLCRPFDTLECCRASKPGRVLTSMLCSGFLVSSRLLLDF